MTAGGLLTHWQLAPTVRIGRDQAGVLHLIGSGQSGPLPLGGQSDELADTLRNLKAGAVTAADPLELGGLTGDQLHAAGWLDALVGCPQAPLFSRQALPTGRPAKAADLDGPLALSPLAVLHPAHGQLALESATAASRLLLPAGSPVLALLGALAAPRTPAELAELVPMLPAATVDAVLDRLVADGFVAPATSSGEAGSGEAGSGEAGWSAHEAWFHARSRWGGHAATDYIGPVDGPAASPVREPYPGDPIRLHRPEPGSLAGADRTLAEVMQARRSVRGHDEANPLRLDQLAEFLYRTAAIRETFDYQGASYTRRPYPAGGTGYELELYLAAGTVHGLPVGLYHYDPAEHALRTVAGAEPAGQLLERARITALSPNRPQSLLVIAARFDRMLGRYRGMGYATVLKDVGVLYQSMYLVATAMGLAPCALGNGDSAGFAAATGTDFLSETSVGEFLLGSRPS
ncbi:MAG: SagB family peptide dehydrogenase [Jatrophihabitantaceae bacterium]